MVNTTHPDILKMERDGRLSNIKPVAHCARCGDEIYAQDSRFQWFHSQRDVCESCFREYIDDMSIYEIADLMGLEYERGGW